MITIAVVLASSLVSSTSITATAPDTHPFSVHDMLAMDRVSDPQVSPDGKWVLFDVRTTDLEANKGRTDVWIAAADGSSVRQLTTHEAADVNPRWMPDGRSFVFLSSRGGSMQVWQLALDGGEPKQLTKLPLDVDNLQVFPDGKRLLFTMEVYPDLAPDQEIDGTAKRDEEREKKKVKARIYDSLLFRHWDQWEDGKRSHVFTWEIGGGAPIDVMHGFDGDSPTKPFGGGDEIAIAPDGKELIFSAQVMSRDAAWSTDVNLYLASATAAFPWRCLTPDNKARDDQPAFSPDGRRIAYLAMQHPGYESDRLRIMMMDRQSGAIRALTEAWDRSPGEIAWSADGKTIYTSADNVGQRSIFAVDAASGKPTLLVDKGSNGSVRVAGTRLLFLQNSFSSPDEIYSMNPDGSDVKSITKMNAAKLANARMGTFEQYSFKGAHDDTVYGFVGKPADFKEGVKYPVAFLIHGGPQGSFGNEFHYRWNPQAYAGAGYATVFVDFHGSTGYGQKFCDAIHNDWGGAPYEDLMKGLDAAIAKYSFLDGSRVAALGASFGGYMINWIAGQTDRFKCLVCHDGNIDERMAYYDTEELWFPEWDHGGLPWEKPENYTKHNPIEFVNNWKTPTLVIHGEQDFRVVDTQGMGTFTALQRRGVPSKLLIFPDENHWVLKPQNSILWHDTVLAWLDQWTKGSEVSHASSGGSATGGR
jgi:dipeptidyl aminopeptidase/acylaminoacyl peptidase